MTEYRNEFVRCSQCPRYGFIRLDDGICRDCQIKNLKAEIERLKVENSMLKKRSKVDLTYCPISGLGREGAGE